MFSIRRFLSGGEKQATGGREAELACRDMLAKDLPAVMQIELEAEPRAWSREVFERWLAEPRVSGHVLEAGGGVCAFFLLAAEPGYLHVLNLAVAASHRRRGLGTAALRLIEDVARERGLPRIDLEVRETNLPAQLLYRKAGYLAVDILRRYYGDEDGYLMRRELE